MATNHDELWKSYSTRHDPDVKKKLMVRYTGLVKYVIHHSSLSLPNVLEEADLVNYGMLGLSDAIDRFQPDRGIKFETYAIPRIKGIIIDEMRKLDWLPRSIREKSRQLNETIRRLEHTHGDEVNSKNIADELSVSVEEYHTLASKTAYMPILSLDRTYSGTDQTTLHEVISADNGENVIDSIMNEETRELIIEALNDLGEKPRLVLSLYYYEELTFKDIGKILGISESRVSQIHTEAIHAMQQKAEGIFS
jgi:RNA polymerase sigma factor for flagellar operon FliA